MKTALLMTTALLISTATAQAHHRHHGHHKSHRHHHYSQRHYSSGRLGHREDGVGSIQRVQTNAGPIRVASAYADRFVGFINALVARGYKPREIGCYSMGHMAHSKHHWGGACDIDQRRRNVTAKPMYHITELAHQYHLTDGCEWRHPDCGHVEVPTQYAARSSRS